LKFRIFIVEDSPGIAAGLSELLTQSGRCEVVGVEATESAALQWSYEHDAGFDLAILDLLLDGGSGFSVLAHMAKYQPGKVVVLSEYVTPVLEERCKAFGALEAFPKSNIDECIRYVLAMAEKAA
jgi:DNA-binding NarL/FixJ family response regulator